MCGGGQEPIDRIWFWNFSNVQHTFRVDVIYWSTIDISFSRLVFEPCQFSSDKITVFASLYKCWELGEIISCSWFSSTLWLLSWLSFYLPQVNFLTIFFSLFFCFPLYLLQDIFFHIHLYHRIIFLYSVEPSIDDYVVENFTLGNLDLRLILAWVVNGQFQSAVKLTNIRLQEARSLDGRIACVQQYVSLLKNSCRLD